MLLLRVIFTRTPWHEYGNEEFSCATTPFALGLVHAAHTQTALHRDFKLSLFFLLYFCLLKLSRSPLAQRKGTQKVIPNSLKCTENIS